MILRNHYNKSGFTLLELLLALGVIAGLAAIAAVIYLGAYRQAMLDSAGQEMMVYLRFAQQRSISQEEGIGWGVHFENPSSGNPFFALFTGNPYNQNNIRERIFLPPQLKYLVPDSGQSIDVMFDKLTGIPNGAQSVEIAFKSADASPARKKTIHVNAAGVVTMQ